MHLWQLTGTSRHEQMIAPCVQLLEPFRLSRQLRIIDHILSGARSRMALR